MRAGFRSIRTGVEPRTGGRLAVSSPSRDSRKVNEWMNEGMKTKTLKCSQSHNALLSPFGKKYKFLINFLSLDIVIQNKMIHQV